MGVLSKLFRRSKRAEDSGGVDSKYIISMIDAYVNNREAVSPVDMFSLVNAYRQWVYIVATKNAFIISNISCKLFIAERRAVSSDIARPIDKSLRDRLYSSIT